MNLLVKYNEVASLCSTINEEMAKFVAKNFINILSQFMALVHGLVPLGSVLIPTLFALTSASGRVDLATTAM